MRKLDYFYERLPVLLQHGAVTMQGAIYRGQRYGDVFARYLDSLRRLEFASGDEISAIQLEQLRETVQFAFAHVPWYRNVARTLGADWRDIRSFDDYARLPQTSKDDIRRHPELFVADVYRRSDLVPWHTSGTTGTPMTLFYAREANQKLWAFVELYRIQAGVSRSQRRGQFTGKVIVPPSQSATRKVFWRYDLANRAMLLSTMHMTPENLSAYARAVARFQPTYLSGYPSAMYLLAQYYLASGATPPHLVAALTSAETVLEHQRKAIEQGLRTRLYDQYGQTEMQSFWYECTNRSMHAHPLAGHTELVDELGNPCSPGQPGLVVLTGFLNRAMPLLRYSIGDTAEWSSTVGCGCSRNMPVIARLHGRADDFIYTAERGFVGRLDTVYKGVENLIEAQIEQKDMDTLSIRYVATNAFGPSDLETLEHNLRERVGPAVRITFEPVANIPRTKSGKFRPVLSHLKGFREGHLSSAAR